MKNVARILRYSEDDFLLFSDFILPASAIYSIQLMMGKKAVQPKF